MATVNSKAVVDNIIEHNGRFFDGGKDSGDETVVKIVQYENMFDGGTAYGLIYEGEDLQRYHNSGACHNPQTIFERK